MYHSIKHSFHSQKFVFHPQSCVEDVYSQCCNAKTRKETESSQRHLKGLLQLLHNWTSYSGGVLIANFMEKIVQV